MGGRGSAGKPGAGKEAPGFVAVATQRDMQKHRKSCEHAFRHFHISLCPARSIEKIKIFFIVKCGEIMYNIQDIRSFGIEICGGLGVGRELR